MKKILLILFFVVVFQPSWGQGSVVLQPTDFDRIETIQRLLNNNQYLDVIIELNKFIPYFPNVSQLYYLRGIAKVSLNDIISARLDFLSARRLGVYGEAAEYLEIMTSRKALVSTLLKDLKDETQLDSIRDFRPVIQPKDIIRGALRPERTCFDVNFYNLTVKILPETKSIDGQNIICFTTITDTKVIQIDLSPGFTITSIKWNDKNLNYTRNEGGLFIDFGEVIPSGKREQITIQYSGIPLVALKPPWNGGFVWEKIKNRYSVGVACEHLGASSWWPNKDHLSDKPDSMIINLQVPKGYQGICNGNLRSQTDLEGDYTNFEWFISYPINNYNVTFYMGDFVNFNETFTNEGGSYQLDYYVLPKNLEKAKKYYAQTKEILTVFEKMFGEYPFTKDGVAMVEAPFEGMEHQSAIAIGGGYGKSNNKRDYWTKDYDYLIIHELAHEWWGNALAIGDMADAWINEGFGTFSEYLFAEEKFGYPEYIRAMASNQPMIFNIWPLVGEPGINSNTFIGGDIYNKGAAMLNNLRCVIDNDSLFKRTIKDFYQKYKYRIVSTSDFVSHVNEYTKTDYNDFFNAFLYETDPPILEVRYSIDKNSHLTFNFKWMNVGKDFSMPFCIAVNYKNYIKLNGTTELQTFNYDDVKDFFIVNEYRYDEDLVPHNAFTYFWTSWGL